MASMSGLLLAHGVIALQLTASPFGIHTCHETRALHAARCSPPVAVSERHNQAYKETIKLFEPLPPDAPLNLVELVSHVPPPGDGIAEDYLVHTSAVPLLTSEECELVIQEVRRQASSHHRPFRKLNLLEPGTPLTCACVQISPRQSEEWAMREGGWTSQRHFNHPTTDIPLAELPRTRAMLNQAVLPSRIYPMLGQAFSNSLPNWRALRVADAFVVKYNATGGQTFLKPHRDGSVLSFNIALNNRFEYEGGGTWFEGLGQALPIEKGHVCCHASGVMHGGHPITSGVRYILVGFVIVEGYQNWGAFLCSDHVRQTLLFAYSPC